MTTAALLDSPQRSKSERAIVEKLRNLYIEIEKKHNLFRYKNCSDIWKNLFL